MANGTCGAGRSDGRGGLVVRYDRFLRASAASELRIQVLSSAAPTGEVAVWTDGSYLRNIEVSSVVPEPVRVEQRGQHIIYVFVVPDGVKPLPDITFRYKP